MKAYFLKLLCLLAVCALLGACGNEDKKPAGRRAVPVKVASVEARDVSQTLQVVGNVEASATVNVAARASGQIAEAPVKAGQDVKVGDVLFKLDQRPFLAVVDEAEATLARDMVRLKKARQDQARYKTLVGQDVISREQYEQSVTDAEALEATTVQEEAALKSARLQLDYATIRAPAEGRVGAVLVDVGNLVKANEGSLIVINTIKPAEVSFAVPERHLPEFMRRFKEGPITVGVRPEGDDGGLISGRLTLIDNQVDRTTGTIRMRASFPNLNDRLWPGQFVRVSIVMDALKGALTIPAKAVLEGLAGQYVYVVRADNSVEARPIKASQAPEDLRVVESGLAIGETVVTDGQLNLAPGFTVDVKKDEPAAKTTSAS